MTCTGPGSDARSSGENGGKDVDAVPPVDGVPPLVPPVGGGVDGTPMKLMVLLAPVLVTTPEPVEFVMVPVLVPTKAPTVLLAPVLVTATEALESVMLPALAPTKPPTALLAPVLLTAPEAETLLIVPAFVPANVPTTCEFTLEFTVTFVRLRLRTSPALAMVPNSPTFWVVDAIVRLAMV